MLKRRIIIGLISILLILVYYTITPKIVFASPDDITLYPIADAMVWEANVGINYGDNDAINVRSQTTDVGKGDQRVFLKFDLSGLSVGADISLAMLRLNCSFVYNLVADVTDVQVRRVTDDSWTEMSITWTNQKAYGIVEDTQIPSVAWIEWNVTDFVIAEFDNDKVVSVCLRSIVEDYDATNRLSSYRSKEYDGGSSKPELYIEYTAISDDKPFYSDADYDGKTQVGLYADFWCYWEDNFALDECYFSTNNTGTWANTSISVFGVASWANITKQLNFTSSVRVEYMWYCSDNTSQWNWTSTYFLEITPLYVTFNFNNSSMGKFYVDYTNTANETQNSYNYNESILLDGITLSSDYIWNNFTWIGGNSVTNNYEYYTSGNNTVWCYFGLSGVGGIDENFFVLGFVIAGCAVLFIIIVIKNKRKKV